MDLMKQDERNGNSRFYQLNFADIEQMDLFQTQAYLAEVKEFLNNLEGPSESYMPNGIFTFFRGEAVVQTSSPLLLKGIPFIEVSNIYQKVFDSEVFTSNVKFYEDYYKANGIYFR